MNSTILYKNAKINFSVTGKGSALVLLHGFLEDSSMWQRIVIDNSTRYKVVTIDLLGHGKSENIGYVHTMDDMATMLAAVLKHLKMF